MEGVIIYNNYNILGTITQNTEDGIYGTLDRIDALFTDTQPLEAAVDESQIEEGEAPSDARSAACGGLQHSYYKS